MCEAFGFESGLDKKWDEAPVFNGLLSAFILVPALVAIIPNLPLVKVMLLSQDVNGILLPVILIYVLKIINDPKVMGEHVNGRIYNTIAWAFSVGPHRALGDARCVTVHLLSAQVPSTRSCERGSMCTSTSALGTRSRMSAAMCSAVSCAAATVSVSSTVTCRSM